MSSLLDKKKSVKNEKKSKYIFAIIVIFILWLIIPMKVNRFAQISYISYNVAYGIAKIFHVAWIPEYIHLRNNAVYMAKIYYQDPEKAIRAMDKAFKAVPAASRNKEYSKLYRDRALIKLYHKDKKGALNDLMLMKEMDYNDCFLAGVLLADEKRFSEASEYCKRIFVENDVSVVGYACLANLYEKNGDVPKAILMYDWAIERNYQNARAYIERANLKRKINDVKGISEDIKRAKEMMPYIEEDSSIINDTLNPKKLLLSIE